MTFGSVMVRVFLCVYEMGWTVKQQTSFNSMALTFKHNLCKVTVIVLSHIRHCTVLCCAAAPAT